MDWTRLRAAATATKEDDAIHITWLGHASLLVQMNGYTILTDPIMSSRRCSPTQWWGPLRYRPAPCTVAELKKELIDGHAGLKDLVVLISHNHYDHLDYQTVRDIAHYFPSVAFVVPFGLKSWFEYWISPKCVVQELDWHETLHYTSKNNTNVNTSNNQKHLKITAVPMNHWSNRTGDRDKTLWCGFSVAAAGGGSSTNGTTTPPSKFLFAGDTAWFDEISHVVGQAHGPWKVAALPIGAYSPRAFMKHAHVNVAEAIQIKDALQCQYAVPIHWGTFPLTTEPVLEPREKLVELMQGRDDADSFTPWLIGETKVF
uniref:Metallo-beta-lactamase domain-containing protein n=1 Tax=Amphora coffeiformis TaxID=265554 RepID=A0A7S3P5V0_9STRA